MNAISGLEFLEVTVKIVLTIVMSTNTSRFTN